MILCTDLSYTSLEQQNQTLTMSQHHLNSTKESAVFSFFMFSFPWFYAWGKRQALNFPIFRWALHFFSTFTLFSIQFTLSDAALSPQSCKTLYHHLFWVSHHYCLQIKAFILLAFLLLPTLFCLFCSLSCQLLLFLYTRVLGFLFLLLCLPLQLQLSHQVPLFPLLLREREPSSALGNLVFLWHFSPFAKSFISASLFLLKLSFDQHLYLPWYWGFSTFSLRLK